MLNRQSNKLLQILDKFIYFAILSSHTCAVRFFNNNQFEDHPALLLLAQFDEPDIRPDKPLPIQPFVPTLEPFPPTLLLVPKPGGGPRANLLNGLPHNSDVVGVACT